MIFTQFYPWVKRTLLPTFTHFYPTGFTQWEKKRTMPTLRLGGGTVAQLCVWHWTSTSRQWNGCTTLRITSMSWQWHGCATLHLTLDKHVSGPRNNICYSGHVKYFSDWLTDWSRQWQMADGCATLHLKLDKHILAVERLHNSAYDKHVLAVAQLCNSASETGQAHLGSGTVVQLCIWHWTSTSRRLHSCATLHLTLDKHISAVERLCNSASGTVQAHLGSGMVVQLCIWHWTSMSWQWHGCETLHLTLDKHVLAVAWLCNSASDTGQARVGSGMVVQQYSASDTGQARVGSGMVVKLPCANHLPHMPSAITTVSTDVGLYSDPVNNQILQCSTKWFASQYPAAAMRENNAAQIVLQAVTWTKAKTHSKCSKAIHHIQDGSDDL